MLLHITKGHQRGSIGDAEQLFGKTLFRCDRQAFFVGPFFGMFRSSLSLCLSVILTNRSIRSLSHRDYRLSNQVQVSKAQCDSSATHLAQTQKARSSLNATLERADSSAEQCICCIPLQ